MRHASKSPIVLVMSRMISPYILLFGMYVVFHGHYSPGGGFQGGALMAASVLLIRVTMGEKLHQLQFKRSSSLPLACVGVLIYLVIGLIPMFYGGMFLDYAYIPHGIMEDSFARYLGILGVEIGVALAVMGVLISLYDNLMEA